MSWVYERTFVVTAIALANGAALLSMPARGRTKAQSFSAPFTHAEFVSPQGSSAKQSRSYDPTIDYTTEHIDLTFADASLHLEVVAAYEGTTSRANPKNVELLFWRDLSAMPDSFVPANNVRLLVDGVSFERRGHLNIRDIGRPRAAAVALVLPFDEFGRLADARTMMGDAFGLDFAVSPDQIDMLRVAVERWRQHVP